MTTLEKLKSAISHYERMEDNKRHFYAMRASCRSEFVDKMDKHLAHAISGANQDVKNIANHAAQLLLEGSK